MAFGLLVIFGALFFVIKEIIIDAERNASANGYVEQRDATFNFNKERQQELTKALYDNDALCQELLGESCKTYKIPPYLGIRGWYDCAREREQIAVRKIARREGWDYYDTDFEIQMVAYYSASRSKRAEMANYYRGVEARHIQRYQDEIALNGW